VGEKLAASLAYSPISIYGYSLSSCCAPQQLKHAQKGNTAESSRYCPRVVNIADISTAYRPLKNDNKIYLTIYDTTYIYL